MIPLLLTFLLSLSAVAAQTSNSVPTMTGVTNVVNNILASRPVLTANTNQFTTNSAILYVKSGALLTNLVVAGGSSVSGLTASNASIGILISTNTATASAGNRSPVLGASSVVSNGVWIPIGSSTSSLIPQTVFFGGAGPTNILYDLTNTFNTNWALPTRSVFLGSYAGTGVDLYDSVARGESIASDRNTYIGFNAGRELTNSQMNTFVGAVAGSALARAQAYRLSTGVGYGSGAASSSGGTNSELISIGHIATPHATSITNMIGVGNQSGLNYYYGINSLFLGDFSGVKYSPYYLSNVVAIGYGATAYTNNQFVLGGTNLYYVGVRTENPTSVFQVTDQGFYVDENANLTTRNIKANAVTVTNTTTLQGALIGTTAAFGGAVSAANVGTTLTDTYNLKVGASATVDTLVVTNNATIGGTLTAANVTPTTLTANTVIGNTVRAGTLVVTTNATFDSLTVTNTLTAQSFISAGGTISASTMTPNTLTANIVRTGTLTVYTNATFDSLTVTNTLTAQNNIISSGTISAVNMTPTTLTANTATVNTNIVGGLSVRTNATFDSMTVTNTITAQNNIIASGTISAVSMTPTTLTATTVTANQGNFATNKLGGIYVTNAVYATNFFLTGKTNSGLTFDNTFGDQVALYNGTTNIFWISPSGATLYAANKQIASWSTNGSTYQANGTTTFHTGTYNNKGISYYDRVVKFNGNNITPTLVGQNTNSSAIVVYNTGETSKRNIYLDSSTAEVGEKVTAIVTDTDGIGIIFSVGADVLYYNGGVTAAGVGISSTTRGSVVTITYLGSNEWAATSYQGTWTTP